ncbi:NfeD family protein [Botrimarina sp.]|uniref:NfeD family protein n=1 Tax=Botrimarina sp. TaxID=2795802 RepID=UPI0032EE1BD2
MNALDGVSIAVLLAVVGSLLIIAEVFVPSGGVLGFLSAAAFIGAVYSAYSEGGWTYGLGFAAGEVLLAPVVIYLALLYLPKTPIGRVLVGAAPREDEVLPRDERDELIGKIGVARSKMLPAGAVEVDGQMFDALSQGQAIEPGEYVKVVEATRTRIVVRRAPAPSDQAATPAADADPLARPASELGLDTLDFDPGDDEPT